MAAIRDADKHSDQMTKGIYNMPSIRKQANHSKGSFLAVMDKAVDWPAEETIEDITASLQQACPLLALTDGIAQLSDSDVNSAGASTELDPDSDTDGSLPKSDGDGEQNTMARVAATVSPHAAQCASSGPDAGV